jgi:hypothetical protein
VRAVRAAVRAAERFIMQHTLEQNLWTRPGIMLRRTTVRADPSGNGAFAPSHPTPPGAFIGMYRGHRWRPISGDHRYRGRDKYVMEMSGWRVSPSSTPAGDVDLALYPLAAVQEPPAGITANCAFVPFFKASDIGLPGHASIACVALYSARELHPAEGV